MPAGAPSQQLGEGEAGDRGPAPTSRELRGHAPRAATTFENTLLIWLPMVKRITMTTIETRTRIKAYSTMPCPFCRRFSWLRPIPYTSFRCDESVSARYLVQR